jgi:hypothetical protein
MRYVLPALPVSGPSGKRARRREAARLAQRQGTARRSGKTQPAVAPPRLPESLFALRVLVVPANAAVLTNQSTSYRTALGVLRSSQYCGVFFRLQAYRLRLQARKAPTSSPQASTTGFQASTTTLQAWPLASGNRGQVKRRVHARTHARPSPRAPPRAPPLSPLPPLPPSPSPLLPPPPTESAPKTFLPLFSPQTSVLSISGFVREPRCSNSVTWKP